MKANTQSLIMGVLNVTPDSFSDGGAYLDPQAAVDHALRLQEEGADIIDIGAESTRPGSASLSLEEEWLRLLPILKALAQSPLKARLSLDTQKPEIMLRACDYPVAIFNDVSGARENPYLSQLAKNSRIYLAMHMRETPLTMQNQVLDGHEALWEVHEFYRKTQQKLLQSGFTEDRLWFDPGIGFGKSDRANLLLIEDSLRNTEARNLVLGISRKSFIGRLLQIPLPKDRDSASKMLELSFLMAKVKVIRTHEVKTLAQMRSLLHPG